MKRFLQATAAVTLISAAGCDVEATEVAIDPSCMNRSILIEQLERDYSETLIGRGLQADASMIELFKSPDGKTFTMLVTRPVGSKLCTVIGSAGKAWQQLQQLTGQPA